MYEAISAAGVETVLKWGSMVSLFNVFRNKGQTLRWVALILCGCQIHK